MLRPLRARNFLSVNLLFLRSPQPLNLILYCSGSGSLSLFSETASRASLCVSQSFADSAKRSFGRSAAPTLRAPHRCSLRPSPPLSVALRSRSRLAPPLWAGLCSGCAHRGATQPLCAGSLPTLPSRARSSVPLGVG